MDIDGIEIEFDIKALRLCRCPECNAEVEITGWHERSSRHGIVGNKTFECKSCGLRVHFSEDKRAWILFRPYSKNTWHEIDWEKIKRFISLVEPFIFR